MRGLRALLMRLAGLINRGRRDRQLDEEIASHIDLHVQDNIRAGMTADEARRMALVRFGGVEAVKEAYRDRRGVPFLETIVQDVRYGLRLLRRSPGFATAAVLSLALGIGANTAIFSIVDALILRPLPVREPERLVQLRSSSSRATWTHPLWEMLQTRAGLADGVMAWSARELDLADGGAVDPAAALVTSASFFDVLGVPPLVGRTFLPGDDRRGGGPDGAVTVISYGFWQRRFSGSADILGRTLSIERVPFTIVGVTPRGFFGPNVGRSFDVAIPIGTYPLVLRRDRLDEGSWWWLSVMARLRAMLSGFFGVLALGLAAIGVYGVVSSAVGSRRSEIGIRMALGATGAEIVALVTRQVAILGGIGAGIGFVASVWAMRLAGSLLYDVDSRDPYTFAAALLILVGVGAAASWLPARRAARIDPARVLREA